MTQGSIEKTGTCVFEEKENGEYVEKRASVRGREKERENHMSERGERGMKECVG